MAAVHGSIGPFESSSEDWTSYTERLQQYFIANDVQDEDKKRALLLSNCGPQTYQLLKNLMAPAKPSGKSFTDIVKVLQDYWQPKPSEIVQRFNFHSRVQKQGESVVDYVSELRRLSEHCGFQDLENMLRDRLVCGVRDARIQKKLLAETGLTFKKAFETAQAVETAELQARELQAKGWGSEKPVHWINYDKPSGKPGQTKGPADQAQRCYRCGGKHNSSECRFKEATCRVCGKVGHIERACRSKDKKQGVTSKKTTAKTHRVHDSPSAEQDEEYNTLYNIKDRKRRPFTVKPLVNGTELVMEIDTGASLSLISEETYQQTWTTRDVAPPLLPSQAHLRTYTGETIQTLGRIEVEVSVNNQIEQLSLEVVQGLGPSLLGLDWLERLKLDWTQVHQLLPNDELHTVLNRHEKVFKDQLGCIEGVKAKLHFKTDSQPKFIKARNLPFALREKVETELVRLVEAGVITSVQHSEWATPIVPVMKQNGTVRICEDHKTTINQSTTTESYPLPRIDDLLSSLAGGQNIYENGSGSRLYANSFGRGVKVIDDHKHTQRPLSVQQTSIWDILSTCHFPTNNGNNFTRYSPSICLH